MIVIYASSHGWGHAARLAPIIDQLFEYKIEVVTSTPSWFLRDSMKLKRKHDLVIRNLVTDPGAVQNDPFNIDVEESCKRLKEHFEKIDELLDREISYLNSKNDKVRLVISDISSFGQLVAEALKVPSVCVATFDWKFVYKNYLDENDELNNIIKRITDISGKFDYCLVPGTICEPLDIGKKKVYFNWLSRKPVSSRTSMREKLGLSIHQDSVLLSFGGHELKKINPKIWQEFSQFQFFLLMPDPIPEPPSTNVKFLSSREWSKHHTDIVNTVDVVFGKTGYGLISEVVCCKKPYLNVERKNNPEGSVLEEFVRTVVPTRNITADDFYSGRWHSLFELVEESCNESDYKHVEVDGEVHIANWIRDLLNDPKPSLKTKESNMIVLSSFIVLIMVVLSLLFRK